MGKRPAEKGKGERRGEIEKGIAPESQERRVLTSGKGRL